MFDSGVPRLLVAGAVSSTATAVRVGLGWSGLAGRRLPRLARLSVQAIGGGTGGRDEAVLREELLGAFRDCAEISWREMRRGIDDLDACTRDGDLLGAQRRRHRVKP